jgi:hypothetical protein
MVAAPTKAVLMTARRNHYFSQCYLKGFSVQKRKGRHLIVYDAIPQ